MATVAKVASSLVGLQHSTPNMQHAPKIQSAQALQLTRPLLVLIWNKVLGSGPVFLNTCLIRSARWVSGIL